MNDIQRLREEARKAHRQANNKVSRLRTQKGVELSGSAYDVRRDPAKIKRYNKKQLEAYVSELKGFTHRANNFVAGSGGTPLPATLWAQHKDAVNRFNKTGTAKFEKIADIFLPGLDRTIGERTEDLKPRARRADGEIANRPYSTITKKASSFPSVEALKKSIQAMEKKIAPDYNQSKLQKLRANANLYLAKIGDPELINRVNTLPDHQFDFLWNYTQFAAEVRPKYLKAQVAAGKMKRDDLITAMTAEGNRDNAIDLLNLAEKLPRRGVRQDPNIPQANPQQPGAKKVRKKR